jgi:VanZ family protein
MTDDRSRAGRFFLAWLPAILGVSVIVCESTETFSAANTSGPLRMVWQSLFGPVPDPRWTVLHHLIRKTGHFVGYGTLSLLFYHAWQRTAAILGQRRLRIQNVLYALVCTLAVASGDEYHQHFLPGRTGVPQDVLLDMLGACTLQALFWLVLSVRRLAERRLKAEAV